MEKKLNIHLFIYLTILLGFSYFFLSIKYQVGNDSTISEWLINYEGGFTKRGIIGQLAIEFSRFFNFFFASNSASEVPPIFLFPSASGVLFPTASILFGLDSPLPTL